VECILINSAGTMPLRAGNYLQATRKVGKVHQNVFVFLKGDASTAAKEFGKVVVEDVEWPADDES